MRLPTIVVTSSAIFMTPQLYSANPEAFPHVLHNTFASENSALIMLGNWTNQSENISFVIDPDKFGMSYTDGSLNDTWEVILLRPNIETGVLQEQILSNNLNNNLALLNPTLPVEARSVIALLLRKVP